MTSAARSSGRLSTSLLGALFLLLGLAGLTFGGVQASKNYAYSSAGDRIVVKGTVVGSVVQYQSAGGRRTGTASPTWCKVVRYPDAPGSERELRSGVCVNSEPRIGEEVEVEYLAHDPVGTARISSFKEAWFVPLVAGGLGLVFAFGGIRGLMASLRGSKAGMDQSEQRWR